ncbi:MAG TPA: hypothetical protein VGP06_10675 [Janthinobacterium sp.]|nr:hypothetical protein [Janthinobacterium sp.]
MKNLLLCTSAAVLLAACTGGERQANQANFTKAMTAYLDKRGDLCLAKNKWPIDVASSEFDGGKSRNAVQMPVLEKLGVVSSTTVTVEKTDEDGNKSSEQAKRYVLTELGQQSYLARPARKRPTGDRYADAPQDLCAAHLSLDKVVGWETPKNPDKQGAAAQTVVTFTYQVKPAAWAADEAARKAFPMVDNILRGAGVLQLQEPFVQGSEGWEALDL